MVEPERVLFARIGRMGRYAGPQFGDQKPQGGGKHNDQHLGHEAFNFRNFDGKLYGFVRPRVTLRKIDSTVSSKSASLDRVTVVFVAPLGGSQKVAGWYKGALVHREQQVYPRNVKDFINHWLAKEGWSHEAASFSRYWIEAPFERAVLLPPGERLRGPMIPQQQKGCFGQCNLRYCNIRGGARLEPWMQRALRLVRDYRGRNLLTEASDADLDEQSAFDAQEKGQGFQSNVAIRLAIESYAMIRAKSELKKLRFTHFEDKHKTASYDYKCSRGGETFYVEVKGTQTEGDSVVITRKEFEHIRAN